MLLYRTQDRKISHKISRTVELCLVYVVIPLLYGLDMIPVHKSIPLLGVFGIFIHILLKDNGFDRQKLGWKRINWLPMFTGFLAYLVALILVVMIFRPEILFITPQKDTIFWIMTLFLYPLWSVIPQELIYRTYFFHRYKDLFADKKIFLVVNALLFSFAHIIFWNWVALLMTFFGGLLFALTYTDNRSLGVVCVQHTLYGLAIYTVGLTEYFYLPF